jgi:alpha-glucosidase (family GH31 glycosyl hydrolase)
MFRALILEYQDDENVFSLDDEYLFGDSFLVAPIMDETCRRRVYLPRGLWTEYWTGRPVAGGRWISVEAPLDTLPLYVRENAIIPMGPVLNYVDEKPADPLTLDLYPAVSGRVRFMLKQDASLGEIKMTVNRKTVHLSLSGIAADTEIRLRNVKEEDIIVNEKPVKFTWDGNVLVIKNKKAEQITVKATFVPPKI